MKDNFKAKIKSELTSFLIINGFAKMPDEDTCFVDFYRDKPTKREFVAIQFDKHGSQRYVLGAGECEFTGITIFSKHVPLDQITLSSILYRVRLQPKRGTSSHSWFRTDSILDRILGKSDMAQILAKTVELYPQIEDWFLTKKIGPNIFVLDLRALSEGKNRQTM